MHIFQSPRLILNTFSQIHTRRLHTPMPIIQLRVQHRFPLSPFQRKMHLRRAVRERLPAPDKLP
jgi:hypothetical protein